MPSQISPRRLWRSKAPCYQHAWQVTTKAAANTADGTKLQRMYSLLSQAHRRNKNQHRGQKWWKSLSLLRRGVGRLVRIQMSLDCPREEGANADAVRRRLEEVAELEQQKRQVRGFIRDVLVGRCYVAFSTVVRDAQFAALGVVLMGLLGSVGKEVGLPRVEVEKIVGISLRQTGSERGEVVSREYSSPRPGWEDLGKVVERHEIVREREAATRALEHEMHVEGPTITQVAGTKRQQSTAPEDTTTTTPTEDARASPSTAKQKKKRDKKRGKKSAIDDLFAGLL